MNGDGCFRAVYHGIQLPTCSKEIAVRVECVDLSMTTKLYIGLNVSHISFQGNLEFSFRPVFNFFFNSKLLFSIKFVYLMELRLDKIRFFPCRRQNYYSVRYLNSAKNFST